jgi:hypothetical protein
LCSHAAAATITLAAWSVLCIWLLAASNSSHRPSLQIDINTRSSLLYSSIAHLQLLALLQLGLQRRRAVLRGSQLLAEAGGAGVCRSSCPLVLVHLHAYAGRFWRWSHAAVICSCGDTGAGFSLHALTGHEPNLRVHWMMPGEEQILKAKKARTSLLRWWMAPAAWAALASLASAAWAAARVMSAAPAAAAAACCLAAATSTSAAASFSCGSKGHAYKDRLLMFERFSAAHDLFRFSGIKCRLRQMPAVHALT